MANPQKMRDLARQQAQNTLAATPSFHSMARDEQLSVYKSLVDANYNTLSRQTGSSRAMADVQKSGELIDDKRHENRRIEQAGDLAGDFVDQVDFPGFVRDLLKGVFDANLEVTIKQMEAFTNLMKAATASLSKFITQIDDTAAFGYLADSKSDEFSMDFDDEEKDGQGNPKPVLTDKDGNRLDIGDNEVKAKIMDAKIAMAREQRALLRETLLMGVTRLVVEKGRVQAGVIFDFKAKEDIQKQDKAAVKDARANSGSVSISGGLLGSLFGGPKGGFTRSSSHSQISVSSAKSKASTSLEAKLTGSVDIQFKSDYFKLDNFAAMYGAIKEEQKAANAAPAGVPALPPAAPR